MSGRRIAELKWRSEKSLDLCTPTFAATVLQVDPSLFTNAAGAIMRSSSLTGGAIGGLPGGVTVAGLQGVSSMGSDIAEAQKEFELGRPHTALQRARQIDSMYSAVAGRWTATVAGLVGASRRGDRGMSAQKMNELKSAQVKMQQLIGPAQKAMRDLITALEHHITNAETTDAETTDAETSKNKDGDDDKSGDDVATPSPTPNPSASSAANDDSPSGVKDDSPSGEAATSDDQGLPDADLLGNFAANYRFGERLTIRKSPRGKLTVTPSIDPDRFYFLAGGDPPRVVRIRERSRSSVVAYDTHRGRDVTMNSDELKRHIKSGLWQLIAD